MGRSSQGCRSVGRVGRHNTTQRRGSSGGWTRPNSRRRIDPKISRLSEENQVRISQLLVLRLIPFVESQKTLNFIQDMDNPDIWIDFKATWKNENPFRNREKEPGQPLSVSKLKPATTGILIQWLRQYLKFCVKRKWLSENWASREYMSQTVVIQQKEPYSEEELDYIYQAAGQQKFKDTLAFVMTLDNTGLRVCDTVQIEKHQLIPFNSPPFKHAIYCNPQKTKRTKDINFVHIPIPGAMPGLRDLATTLAGLPIKQGRYFFRAGTGLMKTEITNWKTRATRVLKIAESLMKKDGKCFSHHPHPHRFRHTFACRLLGWGVPIRIVAQYLGDTENTVRKHYSTFCVAEQHEAASVYGEAMRRMAEKNKAK